MRRDLVLVVIGAVLGALIPIALQLFWLDPRDEREAEAKAEAAEAKADAAEEREATRTLALSEIERVTANVRWYLDITEVQGRV